MTPPIPAHPIKVKVPRFRLIKDDSGERDGYWFLEAEGFNVFIPGEVVRGIVKRERLRATRIVTNKYPMHPRSREMMVNEILGKGNRHEK